MRRCLLYNVIFVCALTAALFIGRVQMWLPRVSDLVDVVTATRLNRTLGIMIDLNSNLDYNFWKFSSSAYILVSGNRTGHIYAVSKIDVGQSHGKLVAPFIPELELDCDDGINLLQNCCENLLRVNRASTLLTMVCAGSEVRYMEQVIEFVIEHFEQCHARL